VIVYTLSTKIYTIFEASTQPGLLVYPTVEAKAYVFYSSQIGPLLIANSIQVAAKMLRVQPKRMRSISPDQVLISSGAAFWLASSYFVQNYNKCVDILRKIIVCRKGIHCVPREVKHSSINSTYLFITGEVYDAFVVIESPPCSYQPTFTPTKERRKLGVCNTRSRVMGIQLC